MQLGILCKVTASILPYGPNLVNFRSTPNRHRNVDLGKTLLRREDKTADIQRALHHVQGLHKITRTGLQKKPEVTGALCSSAPVMRDACQPCPSPLRGRWGAAGPLDFLALVRPSVLQRPMRRTLYLRELTARCVNLYCSFHTQSF